MFGRQWSSLEKRFGFRRKNKPRIILKIRRFDYIDSDVIISKVSRRKAANIWNLNLKVSKTSSFKIYLPCPHVQVKLTKSPSAFCNIIKYLITFLLKLFTSIFVVFWLYFVSWFWLRPYWHASQYELCRLMLQSETFCNFLKLHSKLPGFRKFPMYLSLLLTSAISKARW